MKLGQFYVQIIIYIWSNHTLKDVGNAYIQYGIK